MLFSFSSIGFFQGALNPLPSRSVVETCVMSVLLFGSESRYLNDAALDELERFHCTLDRRILQSPCFHSNTHFHSLIQLCVLLYWPSIRVRVLLRKLNYLRKLVGDSKEKLSLDVF